MSKRLANKMAEWLLFGVSGAWAKALVSKTQTAEMPLLPLREEDFC